MSTHNTPESIESHRQPTQADHESRGHEIRVFPRNDGPFRKHRPSCASCGPVGEWTTDLEDAQRAGRRHEADKARDAVVGVSE